MTVLVVADDENFIDGRVEQRRGMIRPVTSDVTALSSVVANGHQAIHSFPLLSLKVRTASFPQYGFKPAVSQALHRPRTVLT